MNRRTLAIMRKEFVHIVRDWRSLLIVILMPILMILLYGHAITLDMKNIRFAVIDHANTQESREIIRAFSDNEFFIAHEHNIRNQDIEDLMLSRAVQMVLIIPSDLSHDVNTRRSATVQVLIDASDSNVGTFIGTYSEQVLALAAQRLYGEATPLFHLSPRIFYNPDMKSTNFFVPGLAAVILMLIGALLTSIAITREKETGTLEQILVSPVRPIEILVGKVAPYMLIGLIDAALILLSSYVLFDVPVKGSIVLLGLLSLSYIFVALSMGLLISTVAPTQQIAMFMTLMATILPTIMLSGFLFPIPSMPLLLQWLTNVIPATYYLVIIRGIMLKGVGLAELATQALVLSTIGIVLIIAATRRFRLRLE